MNGTEIRVYKSLKALIFRRVGIVHMAYFSAIPPYTVVYRGIFCPLSAICELLKQALRCRLNLQVTDLVLLYLPCTVETNDKTIL